VTTGGFARSQALDEFRLIAAGRAAFRTTDLLALCDALLPTWRGHSDLASLIDHQLRACTAVSALLVGTARHLIGRLYRLACCPRRHRLELEPPPAVAQAFIAPNPRRPVRRTPRTSRARRRLNPNSSPSTMYARACGGCLLDPALQSAPQPGVSGWGAHVDSRWRSDRRRQRQFSTAPTTLS
jgi:hypothetical protein